MTLLSRLRRRKQPRLPQPLDVMMSEAIGGACDIADFLLSSLPSDRERTTEDLDWAYYEALRLACTAMRRDAGDSVHVAAALAPFEGRIAAGLRAHLGEKFPLDSVEAVGSA